jgi:hypothetical protein
MICLAVASLLRDDRTSIEREVIRSIHYAFWLLPQIARASSMSSHSDANTAGFARAALDAGRTAEAKTAFEQAASKAKDSNNSRLR